MLTYIIIGIIVNVIPVISILKEDKENGTLKSEILDPAFWLLVLFTVMVWPMLALGFMYAMIKAFIK